MKLNNYTLIVPFYRNTKMLVEQINEWLLYPKEVKIILVDDGSPESALDVVNQFPTVLDRLSLYRIDVDIPWNRGGARNLGSKLAETDWIVHVDIDHILPAACAESLLHEDVDERLWYRFNRFRRGTADATRRKDAIPDDVEFGPIHPHIDSYLCTKKLYWKVGGYDEDYSGCLGGGSPFLKQLERKAPVKIVSKNVFLCVYTRSVVEDASDWSLSRDTAEFTRRRKLKEKNGKIRPVNPIRFSWRKVL